MFLFINALAIFIFAPIGGYISDKIGSPIVSLIGLSIVSCTLLTYLSLDGDSNTFEIAIRIGFVGLGTGLFQSSNLNLVMGTIKVREFGSGGAISSISRGLGCVASVTLLGGAFTSLYESTVSDVDILDALSSPNSVDAFIFSYHVSYAIGAAIVGLSIVFTMIAWRSMKKSESRIDYKHIDCNNLKTNRKEL
jgi:MFS family permease